MSPNRQRGFVLADAAPVVVKTIAALAAAATAATAATEPAEVIERIILGVRESALLAAIAGAFIGVLVLPTKDTRRVSPPAGPWFRRAALFCVRLAALGGVIVGFAWTAAWAAAVLGLVVPSFGGPAAVPVAGLAGVCVRPILPKFLRALERRTDSFVGGQKEP